MKPASTTPVREATSDTAVEPSLTRRSVGRYELLFEIARGGMGVVYAARSRGERGVDRRVAIKTLPREATGSDDFESFVNEARITARLNHPNVVDTFELCLDEAEPYLVMRLIEGVPLSDLIHWADRRGVPLDAKLVAFIVRQIALGLHAAHELSTEDTSGLIHRDVSPQNVLLSYDGRVYLADFGVAKLLGHGRSTANGVVKGKFSYMSPEQARAERLDRRSDIFSLGVVLYQALTSKEPFSSDSPAGAIFRVLNETPALPRTLRPDLPEALERIVMKCLAKDRDSRFDTAEALAEELRRFLREEGAFLDEKDVERLVLEAFSERREAWRRKLDGAVSSAGVASVGAMAPLGGAIETMSHTVARLPGLEPRRWFARAAVLIAVLAAAVGLFAIASKRDERPPPTAATVEAPSATLIAPSLSPTESAMEPPSAAPRPIEEPQVSATARARATPRATATTVTTVSTPSPTTSSHRGQPFRAMP